MNRTLLSGILSVGLFPPALLAQPPAPAAPASPPWVAKTLPRPGLSLFYRDAGKGEPVLLLMGGPGVAADGLEPVARIEALKKLEIPAIILQGRQDPMPESLVLENQQLLKGCRLVWIERCGHWPWIEQPETLEKALHDFLAALPREAP